MLLTECAAHVPAFWQGQRLCAVVPDSLLYCFASQTPRSMRLTVHHALIPLVRTCPKNMAVAWLAQMLRQLLGTLPERLTALWTDLKARQAGSSGSDQAAQNEDEIVQEVRCAAMVMHTQLRRALHARHIRVVMHTADDGTWSASCLLFQVRTTAGAGS